MLLGWLRGSRPPGPRHLFVSTGDVIDYWGPFDTEEGASDFAQKLIAREVISTGEVVLAKYRTKRESQFNRKEKAAVAAALEDTPT
jgi:hypothetical protein